MKLKYSIKILILTIVTLFFILVLDVFSLSYTIEEAININSKVKQLNLTSQEREMDLNSKDSVLRSTLERARLTGYFVGAGNVETVKFTKYLEDLTIQTGVNQSKSINYEPVAGLAPEILSAIRFKFSVSGPWKNVLTFLQQIEKLPRVTSLSGVSLVANTETKLVNGVEVVRQTWSANLDFTVLQLKK